MSFSGQSFATFIVCKNAIKMILLERQILDRFRLNFSYKNITIDLLLFLQMGIRYSLNAEREIINEKYLIT